MDNFKDLEELIKKARKIVMTDVQKRAQRISFAYGNLNISNPNLTKETVEEASMKKHVDRLCDSY